MSYSTLAHEKSAIITRVDAGVAWLDTRDKNWRSRVDRDTLDMSKPRRCIVGQAFGLWLNTTLSRSEYIKYGFLAPDGLTGFEPEPFDYRYGYYGALTNRWRLML